MEIFKLLTLTIFIPTIIALLLRDKEGRHVPLKKKFKILSAVIALLIIVIAIANMSTKFFSTGLKTIFFTCNTINNIAYSRVCLWLYLNKDF